MGLGPVHPCLASLLVLLLLFCRHVAGRGVEQRGRGVARLDRARDMPERDVTTPLATVPLPTNPTAASPLATAEPSLAHPVAAAGAGSWCVASPSAGAAALQVALDYACGQGTDCSPIQPGGSCRDPDTVRDHASYAFNSYYQRNPVQTSCDFAGAAILTSTDPSTTTCKYPSTSTGASVLNTTNPTFGSPPGGYYNSPPGGFYNPPPLYGSMSPPDYGAGISAATTPMMPRRMVRTTSLTCLLVASLSLNLYG
uniref:Uncharacterized protein n=1 Tax=Avena sativa TaxID=4498 RepID=A0ACD5T6U8_AVESA